ncbi:PREDICTED: uncharacterized protein LOC109581780 [Amphimedon queenslandica]|uniref:PID domain-containing protein n=1 Tax=Amphimedon queenslandica TaxID=400682 RepID=A0A1X7UYR2_AMPQE|nr:PREDICTED: uncharacterized protein LOC109581780 [Amphimedon queenslandica]|eukprot:XP_019851749.1 PREDICTED: uncharacterized protein LOC109581780 [Amphimedon queenslandica]
MKTAAASRTNGNSGTLYSQVTSYYASDFVPSRETRVSSNPLLQEHLFTRSADLLHPFNPRVPPVRSPGVHIKPLPLQGKYIELYFTSRNRSESGRQLSEEDLYSTVRRPHSNSDPAGLQAFGSVPPPVVERRKRPSLASSRLCDVLEEEVAMYRPTSFALAITENPIIFDEEEDGDLNTNGQGILADRHYYLPTKQNGESSTPVFSPSPSPSPPLAGGPAMTTQPHSSREGDMPLALLHELHPLRQWSVQKSGSLENLLSQRKPNPTSSPANVFSSPGSKRRVSEPAIAKDKGADMDLFLWNSSGEEISRFSVAYLGSCDIDQYHGCVDECAKRLFDNKAMLKATDVLAQVCTRKIRLYPPSRHGPLFKSFTVSEVLEVSQCSKNKRLVGIVLWQGKIPHCHLLRCPDQIISNDFLQSLELAVLSMREATDHGVDELHESLPLSLSCFPQEQLSASLTAVYIGCTRSPSHKEQSISDIIGKALTELKPSQSHEVSVNLTLSNVEVKDSKGRILLFQHTRAIQCLGVYQIDSRYLGYVTRDSNKSTAGHVFWFGTHQEVVKMVTALKSICQVSYQRQQETANETGLLSRLKSLRLQRSFSSHSSTSTSTSSSFAPHSPSFQSYLSSTSHVQSSLLDVPRKRKDGVTVPTINPSVSEFSEEEYVKFSLSYVGTANLQTPFTPQSILEALEAFNEKGVAAGMAPPIGNNNIIGMYVSPLGINLSDKKQKNFVNRNYPRKSIVGYCRHPFDKRYFSFATLRPGFEEQVKVHLFIESSGQVVDQIMESIQFWLQIPPVK